MTEVKEGRKVDGWSAWKHRHCVYSVANEFSDYLVIVDVWTANTDRLDIDSDLKETKTEERKIGNGKKINTLNIWHAFEHQDTVSKEHSCRLAAHAHAHEEQNDKGCKSSEVWQSFQVSCIFFLISSYFFCLLKLTSRSVNGSLISISRIESLSTSSSTQARVEAARAVNALAFGTTRESIRDASDIVVVVVGWVL